jgi:hypothetical protein
MNPPGQPEFNFEGGGADATGLDAWHRQRRAAVQELAEKLGLPLGRRVEVRLIDGVILQGELRLQEETLFLDHVETANIELAVGRTNFRHSEIEACVRLD